MQQYDRFKSKKSVRKPSAATNRERSTAVLEEFYEKEALIKKYVLEEHLTIESHKIAGLIHDWKALYGQKYGHLTDELWQTTSMYKWLVLHYVFSEVQKSVEKEA